MTTDTPPVWKMLREAIDALGSQARNQQLREWVLKHDPGTNANTIDIRIKVCSVNLPSRIYNPENPKPRLAEHPSYDFLFRTGTGQVS